MQICIIYLKIAEFYCIIHPKIAEFFCIICQFILHNSGMTENEQHRDSWENAPLDSCFLNRQNNPDNSRRITSSRKTLEEVLPQGSSLSRHCFSVFIKDLPSQIKISKALLADDIVIWTSDEYPILARGKLKKALATYCILWKIKMNKYKSV